jgi:hypothetical protein
MAGSIERLGEHPLTHATERKMRSALEAGRFRRAEDR